MRNLIEESVFAIMKLVTWGLGAVLLWAFVLAVFHAFDIPVPSWLAFV